MIKEVPAMTVRQQFGELLNEVQCRHGSVFITKTGKPVAALIDIPLFEKIRKLKIQFDLLTMELGKAYESVDSSIAKTEIKKVIKNLKADESST